MNLKNITLSKNEKVALVSNLTTMLSAGIPILETVDSLLDGSKGNQKKVLQVIRDDLSQGKHLYVSFSAFPSLFDKVTVNLIKASEEAGTLDVALKDLKNSILKEAEFNDKVRSALLYPLIIFVVFVGVMLIILTFVVPRISGVFLRLKVPLPLPTKIMILISDLMLHYTIPFITGVFLIVAGIIFFYRAQKRFFLGIVSSFPGVRTLAREIDLTRFSRSFYLLLSSGIPITTALELVQDVVIKKEITRIISKSREMVSSGKKLSEGFSQEKNVIPSIMIKIIEAGERTGTLDKSMQDISEYLDYQVSTSLKTLTALLEPVMLVIVGVLIGGMMLAIIAPIYSLIGQVAPH